MNTKTPWQNISKSKSSKIPQTLIQVTDFEIKLTGVPEFYAILCKHCRIFAVTAIIESTRDMSMSGVTISCAQRLLLNNPACHRARNSGTGR